jgi:hypothetical protein
MKCPATITSNEISTSTFGPRRFSCNFAPNSRMDLLRCCCSIGSVFTRQEGGEADDAVEKCSQTVQRIQRRKRSPTAHPNDHEVMLLLSLCFVHHVHHSDLHVHALIFSTCISSPSAGISSHGKRFDFTSFLLLASSFYSRVVRCYVPQTFWLMVFLPVLLCTSKWCWLLIVVLLVSTVFTLAPNMVQFR